MGLTPLKLDDRTYEELRNELIRRIPVHAPEWTDHNAADPGIALLELFAWLAENLLYRMNRVPDRAQREFLRLLNLPFRPAGVARTRVRFSLREPAPQPVVVPFGGARQAVTVLAPSDIAFELCDEVTVLPVEALPVVKEQLDDTEDLQGLEDIKQLVAEQLPEVSDDLAPDQQQSAQAVRPTPYRTLALPVPEGGAQPPVTALAQTLDRTLWVALFAPKPLVNGLTRYTSPTLGDRLKELRRELRGQLISFGVWIDNELCGPQEHMDCPKPNGNDARYPVVWEIATGRFRNGTKRFDHVIYERLPVEDDGTSGLMHSGVLRLRFPGEHGLVEPGFGTWTGDDSASGLGDPDLLGIGDLPPRLDDPEFEERVLTWIRCYRPKVKQGTPYPDPRIRHIDVNMVEVEQAVTAPRELLGSGEGRPAQVVKLAHTPVLPNSVQLQVRETRGWVNWRQVDDLAVAEPNDPFYELDALTGEVRFGDGIHGRMPRPGEVIRCIGYRYGGGAQGNVAAGAIARVKSSDASTSRLKVTNPFPAAYGRDAETDAEALRRIPQSLRHRNRAVASEDFQDLALATPGVHVGRVEMLPRHKPHERVDGVPGVVTLILVPAYDVLHPNEPTPDRDMLRRVCEHLEGHRLVTTELYVTPPEYIPLWTSVAIEVQPGYGPETVRRWVELAVRQYLAPLPPYGPAGKGWPFGRDVRSPDIAAAVLRVEGVRLVNDVKVVGPETAGDDGQGEGAGTVVLQSWQLPVTRAVVVREDTQAHDIDREINESAVDERPEWNLKEGEDGGDGGPAPMPVPAPVELEEC